MEEMNEPFRAFLAAFNLERFGAGLHIARDARGMRVRDIRVQSIWLACIQPSFHPYAYLMVMHTNSHPLVLFCFRGADSLPDIRDEPFEFPGLEDKVLKSLKHVDLSPRESSMMIDGIGYSLHIRAKPVNADLQFFNPSTDSLKAIEHALFAVAESFAQITGRRDIADYVEVWRKYLR